MRAFHPSLNIDEKAIANKYREGNVKKQAETPSETDVKQHALEHCATDQKISNAIPVLKHGPRR